MAALSSNRLIGITTGVLYFTSACAFNSRRGSEVSLDDSNVFLAVAQSVKQNAGPLPIEIDPRPLRADPEVLEANASTLAHVADGAVQARLSVLRRLGIPATDNATYRHCSGVLVGPPPPGQSDQRLNCPDRTFFVAAIGLPRAGGAYLPSGPIDEREAGLRTGHVAVRVLLTHLSPQGASMTAYDYVFKRDFSAWSLVKRVSLFYTD